MSLLDLFPFFRSPDPTQMRPGKRSFHPVKEMGLDTSHPQGLMVPTVDGLSVLPSTSVVARWTCKLWEACLVSDVQEGDILLTRTLVKNTTSGQSAIYLGSIADPATQAPVGPLVNLVKTGMVQTGSSVWAVTSHCKSSGNNYTTTLVSGFYGLTTKFSNPLPIQLQMVPPALINKSYGFLWLPIAGMPECSQVCGKLGTQCDCPAFAWGTADRFKSAVKTVLQAPISTCTLGVFLPPAAIASVREDIGPGDWIMKSCLSLQGDRWTNHTQQTVDQAGHHIALSKAMLTVK